MKLVEAAFKRLCFVADFKPSGIAWAEELKQAARDFVEAEREDPTDDATMAYVGFSSVDCSRKCGA